MKFKRNIAPSTFPVTLEFAAIAALPLPSKGLIYGEQSFRYERPIFVDEDIYCFTEVKDYLRRREITGTWNFSSYPK